MSANDITFIPSDALEFRAHEDEYNYSIYQSAYLDQDVYLDRSSFNFKVILQIFFRQ